MAFHAAVEVYVRDKPYGGADKSSNGHRYDTVPARTRLAIRWSAIRDMFTRIVDNEFESVFLHAATSEKLKRVRR